MSVYLKFSVWKENDKIETSYIMFETSPTVKISNNLKKSKKYLTHQNMLKCVHVFRFKD